MCVVPKEPGVDNGYLGSFFVWSTESKRERKSHTDVTMTVSHISSNFCSTHTTAYCCIYDLREKYSWLENKRVETKIPMVNIARRPGKSGVYGSRNSKKLER
jgi:hypothetical protein